MTERRTSSNFIHSLVNNRGFSLIELAMVLIIVGLLLSVGMSLIGPLTKRGKNMEARDDVKAAKEALLGYAIKNGFLPPEGATALSSIGIRSTDPWEKTILYKAADIVEGSGKDACGVSGSTGITIQTPTGQLSNIAFVIVSGGDNYNVQTAQPTTEPATITVYDSGTANVDNYVNDVDRKEEYDDIVAYASIDEIRAARGCPQPLAIASPPRLSQGEEDSFYSYSLQAIGGKPPYTWIFPLGTQSIGFSPPTLTLFASGTISGTIDLNVGSVTGELSACSNEIILSGANYILSDAAGSTLPYTITIPVRPKPMSINNTGLPSTTQGVTVANFATLSGSGGKPSSYSWSLSNFSGAACPSTPSWLTLNPSTGVLGITGSGPSTAGTCNFTATLADGCGSSSSKAFSITVNSAPTGLLCSLTASPSSITAGQTTNLSWNITNGPASGTWNVAPGGSCPSPVPSGSGSSCVTGAIASTTTYTLSITNGTSNGSCSATVSTGCLALSNTTSSPLLGGIVGSAYMSTITYTGGQGSVACSISAGSLPPGLTLSGCSITGTLATSGTYNFTTRVTDSCATPQTSDKATSITVTPAPVGCTSYRVWNDTGSHSDFLIGSCKKVTNGTEITTAATLASGGSVTSYSSSNNSCQNPQSSISFAQAATADTNGDCCVNFTGSDRTCTP